MTRDEALDVLRRAVARVLEVAPDGLTGATRLVEDLQADSLALVEVVELVEEELGIRVDDALLDDLVTLGDAADVVVGATR